MYFSRSNALIKDSADRLSVTSTDRVASASKHGSRTCFKPVRIGRSWEVPRLAISGCCDVTAVFEWAGTSSMTINRECIHNLWYLYGSKTCDRRRTLRHSNQ